MKRTDLYKWICFASRPHIFYYDVLLTYIFCRITASKFTGGGRHLAPPPPWWPLRTWPRRPNGRSSSHVGNLPKGPRMRTRLALPSPFELLNSHVIFSWYYRWINKYSRLFYVCAYVNKYLCFPFKLDWLIAEKSWGYRRTATYLGYISCSFFLLI